MTSIKNQIRAEIERRIENSIKNVKHRPCHRIEELCELLSFLDTLPEQPVEWKDEYREEDLRTRFAFYTYKNEEDDGVLYLSNVFVEESSRNAGFGTKILEAAEKVAETIGAITIRLKVKQDSPANAWYRKHGYGYIAFEGDYDWLEKNLEYLKPKRKEQPVEGLEKENFWVEDPRTGEEKRVKSMFIHLKDKQELVLHRIYRIKGQLCYLSGARLKNSDGVPEL